MSSSSKTKILVTAVVFLLLTNIAMLVFFLCCKGPDRKNDRGGREAMMRTFLQKDIGFTAQQLQQYDTLAKVHKDNMRSSSDEMRNNREQDFKEISSGGFNDSTIALVATRSAERQKGMLGKMFLYFKDIRKICLPEQQPKFDSLFYKIWNRKDDKHKKPGN